MPTEIKNDRTPKKDTLKGGKELTKKQTKSCSICKQSGNTKPMCPLKYIDKTRIHGSINMQTQTQIREPKTQKIAINKKSIEVKSYSNDIRICQAKSERPPCAPSRSCGIVQGHLRTHRRSRHMGTRWRIRVFWLRDGCRERGKRAFGKREKSSGHREKSSEERKTEFCN
ncbi:hypothetical protein Cgig2_033489 [Carnegiea gigantea]|uniref:Uncharacterized protein n=1 Tax=Carnegiea gigantea TaxID=171969 RepID=A0A9Q1GPM6_9CARY|nr:hypothetical protein Cgig2_033489 [Carnegiea gigantea]